MLLETANGERGTGKGKREKEKMGTATQRIGNEVSDTAREQVRFCSHFSFSRSSFLEVPRVFHAVSRFDFKCNTITSL